MTRGVACRNFHRRGRRFALHRAWRRFHRLPGPVRRRLCVRCTGRPCQPFRRDGARRRRACRPRRRACHRRRRRAQPVMRIRRVTGRSGLPCRGLARCYRRYRCYRCRGLCRCRRRARHRGGRRTGRACPRCLVEHRRLALATGHDFGQRKGKTLRRCRHCPATPALASQSCTTPSRALCVRSSCKGVTET